MGSFKKVEKNKNNIFIGKVECPECKSMNTTANNNMATSSFATIFICFLCFSISIWIPILGWIVAPTFALVGIGSLIPLVLSIFTKEYTFVCNDCTAKYKINKSEYKNLVKNKNI